MKVQDLEGRSFAYFTPYLVVDHWAIAGHLGLVMDIMAARKFAIIIPETGSKKYKFLCWCIL